MSRTAIFEFLRQAEKALSENDLLRATSSLKLVTSTLGLELETKWLQAEIEGYAFALEGLKTLGDIWGHSEESRTLATRVLRYRDQPCRIEAKNPLTGESAVLEDVPWFIPNSIEELKYQQKRFRSERDDSKVITVDIAFEMLPLNIQQANLAAGFGRQPLPLNFHYTVYDSVLMGLKAQLTLLHGELHQKMIGNSTSEPDHIDLLVVTALTEEAQVTIATLDAVATFVSDTLGMRHYDYPVGDGRVCRVVATSAHVMGAVGMGTYVAPIFKDLRPVSAALVGIAAAVDTNDVELGDVPFPVQVFSYDDIAVQGGTLTFRPQGYQVDPLMRRAAGELRLSVPAYTAWQQDCTRIIHSVIAVLNQLQRRQVTCPDQDLPHLLVGGVTGGGPFLLRDKDFRDALTEHRRLPSLQGIKVSGPVHPKLVSAEMESHGFMRAALEHGVPATVLKGISDVGDADKAKLEEDSGGFFRAFACSNAVLAALHILRRKAVLSGGETKVPQERITSSEDC